MKPPRLLARALASLAAVIAVATTAIAARAAEPVGPKERTAAIYTEVQRVALETADRAALVAKVLAALDTFIDYDAFAERTLKTTWPKLTGPQRDLFKASFRKLVIRTYAKKFTPGARFEVAYRGDAVIPDATRPEAKVKTTLRHGKVAADVDYLLVRKAIGGVDAWRAADIVIDDVSMALNWRNSFEKIVTKDGFDGLIRKIEEKTAKEQ
jgi:phospholipid transport system substrate-binding protein